MIRALVILLALAVATAGVQTWRLHRLQASVAQAEHDRAEQTREAERLAGRKLETIANETHTQVTRARVDAAADAPATPGGEAATGPGLVLADVLSSAAGRAVDLAAALDEARTAGIACERAYDAVITPP